MIPFNKTLHLGPEADFIKEAIGSKTCGDGDFTKNCQQLLTQSFDIQKVLLTTSGTSALEMAAMLIDIKPGDEVIMPSYTFPSTANAFVRLGARISFVDIRPDTMNIDENLIEQAITPRTRAIVPIHYAGVGCEMNSIARLAEQYNLYVVEDAAQAVMSKYNDTFLGTLGHFGCYSFHETKNYSMGEGGALLINNESFNESADIIWEKGTNRAQYLAGQVDKYTWVSVGSSFVPSELCAAYLYPGLIEKEKVNQKRLKIWQRYYGGFQRLAQTERVELPFIPEHCEHNAHMFYIKTADINERNRLIAYLSERDIIATFHYIPLHSSPAGRRYSSFLGEDRHTTVESERLLRLPLFYALTEEECDSVIHQIHKFYNVH